MAASSSSVVPEGPAQTSSAANWGVDALSTAVASQEEINWYPTGRICLMEISSYTGIDSQRQRVGLHPFGCFTTQVGNFVRVKHWVDFRHAPLTGNPSGPRQQAWPCHMRLGIQHMSGRQSLSPAGIETKQNEALYFHLPAKHLGGSDENWTKVSDVKACTLTVDGDGEEDGTIRNHPKGSNAEEAAAIKRMVEQKSLYEIEIETSPRNLAPSNVFIGDSKHEEFKELVKAVTDLHELPEITFLVFRLVFCAPDTREDRDDWLAKVQRGINNFRKAQKMENEREKWPGEIYTKMAGRALETKMGVYKDIDHLPSFTPPHFDVSPSIQDMVLMHGLDLHYLHEQERAKLRDLENGVFEARFIELNNEQKQTCGCFVRIGDEQPGAEALVKGLKGYLTFPDHNDAGKISFILSRLPLLAGVRDIFLVVHVDQNEKKLPCKVVDLRKGTAKQDMADLISASDFTRVSLHGAYTNATEKQHWKSLQAINPKMNETGEEAVIAQYVCRILAGHGLGRVGRKSVWAAGVLDFIDANMGLLNERFAYAIKKPGAKFSKDQLRVIAYLADSPEDLLLVIDGFAGTRKSSTMALLACLLQMFGQTARVLVVAKMHKTINTTAETMVPIIESFLDKRVVRDWGDKSDLYLLIWLLKGRPRDFDAAWTIRGSIEEQADLKDLMDCVEEAIETTPGTSTKAPGSAIRRTVVWQMLEELKELGLIDVLSEGPQQGSKRPRSEEEDTQEGHTKSRKLSAEWIDESRAKLAFEKPDLSSDDWKFKVHDFLRQLIDKLDHPWKNADEKEALQLLRKIKSEWIRQFCGVLCTTIFRVDSGEVRDYAATHVFAEDAQFIDDHDMRLMLAEFARAWKILIGDSKQPAPYVEHGKFNKFSVVRRESTLEREVRRGRHHVKLTESGRMGPSGISLASELIYDGKLVSAVIDHPRTAEIVSLFQKALGSEGRQFPHVFIDLGKGRGVKRGAKQSTTNPVMIAHALHLIQILLEANFDPSDIGVVNAYGADEVAIELKFRRQFPKDSRPEVGTILGMMGREAPITIFLLPNTSSLAFMNKKGSWCVGLTRSRLATIVIANDVALQELRSFSKDKFKQFIFYDKMKCFFESQGAFVRWPDHLAVSEVEEMEGVEEGSMEGIEHLGGM